MQPSNQRCPGLVRLVKMSYLILIANDFLHLLMYELLERVHFYILLWIHIIHVSYFIVNALCKFEQYITLISVTINLFP